MNVPEFKFVEFWFPSLLHSFLASRFPNRTISKWRIVSAHAAIHDPQPRQSESRQSRKGQKKCQRTNGRFCAGAASSTP